VTPDEVLARTVHEEWGRLVALLLAQFRRLDLVEDAPADAVEAGARTWPRDGVPERPAAWLLTAARRRVLDRLRAEAMAARKEPLLVVDAEAAAARTGWSRADPGDLVGDEVLRLVLMCCHPALAPVRLARVTLALAPDEPVLSALLALLLLQHSRRDARVDAAGRLVLSLTRTARGGTTARSPRHSTSCPGCRRTSPPRSPRATACRPWWRPSTRSRQRHPTPGGTGSVTTTRPWSPSTPAVRLAAAVALAERDGPHAGLAALDDLDGAMPHSHRLPAVRASCSPGSGSTLRPSSRSTWRSPAAATRSSATT